MKVISLWQPFASLIFADVKRFETRSFLFPKKLLGQRIGIHATAKFTPTGMVSDDLDALCIRTFGEGYRDTLPRSAILGTVVLNSAHLAETVRANVSHDEITAGNWDDGRVVWALRDGVKFDPPVAIAGQQGFWDWTEQ